MDAGLVVFDRYRLEERIGRGGMGVVWRATDLLLDQTVALKRVSLAGVDDGQAEVTRQRALREARLAARLRHHRHVVATYDVRVEDGDVWLVLEYLRSRSLAQILREGGPLDPGRAARIGAQVAGALAAAHALGIEHRDVTPGNVLITEDGTAKLTDFGISHLAGDTQLTQTGMICGTCAYLAPEVAKTGKSSPASDVFSLGSTLYAAIEGQPPFGTADNALQMLSIVGVGIICPPAAAGAFTPLLLRLLELDPATRPDAATARDQLDDFATQASVAGRDPQTTPRPPRRWLPRHPVTTAALALITLAVLAGGITLALVSSNTPAVGVAARSSAVGAVLAVLGQVAWPVAAPSATATSTFRDVATGFCLDSDTNGNAYAFPCNGGNFQNWVYAGSGTSTIRDVATGFCLDSDTNGNAYTLPCNGGNFQNWVITRSGGPVRDVATGFCLDSDTNGNAYTFPCNGGNFQNWYHQ